MKHLIFLLIPILVNTCNHSAKQTELESNKSLVESEVSSATSTEAFIEIAVKEFNQDLAQIEVVMSATDVMKLYYPLEVESQEGNEKITIQDEVLENGHTLVTLIHDNFLDDSLKGEKYVMELQEEYGRWTVISLKKNWKCWAGRGHTDWGIELCL